MGRYTEAARDFGQVCRLDSTNAEAAAQRAAALQKASEAAESVGFSKKSAVTRLSGGESALADLLGQKSSSDGQPDRAPRAADMVERATRALKPPAPAARAVVHPENRVVGPPPLPEEGDETVAAVASRVCGKKEGPRDAGEPHLTADESSGKDKIADDSTTALPPSAPSSRPVTAASVPSRLQELPSAWELSDEERGAFARNPALPRTGELQVWGIAGLPCV